MNKENGELVLDDELFGSCAADAKNTTLSYRKASKEVPVADAIADYHLGCLFGMCLRVKGETEIENIMNLFQ